MLFRGLLSVTLGVQMVALCHDRVMRGLFNRARFVVLRSLTMMLCGFFMMLGGLDVVFGNFWLRGS